MRYYARRAWGFLAAIAFLAALAAFPGVAFGAIEIQSATVEGVTSTSAPPGSVMPARVTAKLTGTSVWRATRPTFNSQPGDCKDHTNYDQGRQTAGFNVTAPADPGNYDVGFDAHETNNCSGTASDSFTLADAIRVTTPAKNPDLPPRCGINVMLVLDESGSIDSSGQTDTVKNATRAFLNSLSGTGAKVSIVDFSTSAQRPVGYTTVTPQTMTSTFDPYLANDYNPSGWTNWEDAFQKVKQANAQGPAADLVVFITDGDPTARNNPPGNPITNLTEGDVTAMRAAAREADLVKGQGSHVFALGVGAAVTTPASAARLTAISGPDQYPKIEFGKADYTLVQDFDDLAKALRKIALELCEASVTVTKKVNDGDGYEVAKGWKFTATVSTSPGDFTWVQPAGASGSSASEDTDEEGIAKFQWRPSNSDATSTVKLDEAVKPGYEFVDAVCTRHGVTRTRTRTLRRTSEPVKELTLKPLEYYECTVRNKIKPPAPNGMIEIKKDATPDSSQEFQFAATPDPLEDFTLVDDGKDESQSLRIFTGLAPGTYTVGELVPDNWELSGVTCITQAATATVTGAQVAITLAAGGSAVCTYNDLRIEPPPPEPPPPEPPPPGPPEPPPPTPPPGTVINVVKTAPKVARVGQRVRFRLTVTNTGTVTARNVQVADVPPAAVALASMKSATKARVVRGNAIWRLGNLAPGASRTIRGSVRFKAGTPGKKRNLVLATAVNADLARSHADTRLLPQRRQAPPVTG